MRTKQSTTLDDFLLQESRRIGSLIARLRIARNLKQATTAIRAGMSRNTAYRIETGDPGVALGQILKYLDVLVPGMTLKDLLLENNPALVALAVSEKKRRVRDLPLDQLKELDF